MSKNKPTTFLRVYTTDYEILKSIQSELNKYNPQANYTLSDTINYLLIIYNLAINKYFDSELLAIQLFAGLKYGKTK